MVFVSFLIIGVYRILFCGRHVILQQTDSIRTVRNIRKDYPGIYNITYPLWYCSNSPTRKLGIVLLLCTDYVCNDYAGKV